MKFSKSIVELMIVAAVSSAVGIAVHCSLMGMDEEPMKLFDDEEDFAEADDVDDEEEPELESPLNSFQVPVES